MLKQCIDGIETHTSTRVHAHLSYAAFPGIFPCILGRIKWVIVAVYLGLVVGLFGKIVGVFPSFFHAVGSFLRKEGKRERVSEGVRGWREDNMGVERG